MGCTQASGIPSGRGGSSEPRGKDVDVVSMWGVGMHTSVTGIPSGRGGSSEPRGKDVDVVSKWGVGMHTSVRHTIWQRWQL